MNPPDLLIRGGLVVDPANHAASSVRDLWIQAGKVVAPPDDEDVKPARTIDARGYVVLPGGVDVHCHIAGSKVNAARGFRPEESRERLQPRRAGLRAGTTGSTPTTFTTGYMYTGLGYTTAVDAAIPPLSARHAHHELDDTPIIDKAFLLLVGNHHFLMDRMRDADLAAVRDTLAWLLTQAKAFGCKVVNPGGVERWKEGGGNVASLDDRVDGFGVTPRTILTAIAQAVDELQLPHPMHLHGLNLGLPGNARTTLETMKALDGRRVHLAHIQFHSYADQETKSSLFGSGVAEIAEHVNTHPGVSVDVGQVMFGETTSMTADGAVGHYLARLSGRKWVNVDVEMETGCGVVPITYRDQNAVHALQWAIGMEWFLRVADPWRIALSTDHPNGGSFMTYPRIIALLMSRDLRSEAFGRLPESTRRRSPLGELDREYTLEEIAIITRAAPARLLGLVNKGHLGVGADADVTIHVPGDDKELMFSLPKYVLKAGEVVLDDGELRTATAGRTLHVEPQYDDAIHASIQSWFERDYSIRMANYGVRLDEIACPWRWESSGTGSA